MDDKKTVVEEAKERYDLAKDAYAQSRAQSIEDTRFAMGDSDNGWQWPDDIRDARVASQKVCLTVNITAQHCNQTINNMRQNRPAGRVVPGDGAADKKTADILGGIIRKIQAYSNSDDAHDIGAEHCIYGGIGHWRVLVDYESETSFNQIIWIKSIPNPLLVYVDPFAVEPDKSDAEWGFVFEDISKEQCERDYPDIDPASWIEDAQGWVTKDSIRIAEYFYCTYKDDTALLLIDESTKLKSDFSKSEYDMLKSQGAIIKERPTQKKAWKWCKLVGGQDEPVEEKDWLGSYLPIITVIGKELNIDGQIIRKGMVRDLKDPARMVNFSYSEAIQTVALQNKIPYIAAAEAIEGYEQEWSKANIANASYLPFNAFDDNNNPLPVPHRQEPAVMPAAQVQMLQLSTEQMRAASGQQNANFGIKSEAASGVGIQRLKAQGEIATFHFPDNQLRGLRYEMKVLIDLIQKYYDTKRVMMMMGLDGKEEAVTLDPDMPKPYHEQYTQEDVQKIFNPNIGLYNVAIDTGPSYQTQRQEAADAMIDLSGKNPQLMQVAGDIIVRTLGFPMSDELADRLQKTLPPGLQDNKGAPPIPPEIQQKLQQDQQTIQQMDHTIQQMSSELESKQIEQKKVEVDQMNAQTNRMKAQGELQIKAAQLNQPHPEQAAEMTEEQKLQFNAKLQIQLKEMDIKSQKELKLIDAAMSQLNKPEGTEDQASENEEVSETKQYLQQIAQMAQALSAPREVIRDENGRAMGVRTVL